MKIEERVKGILKEQLGLDQKMKLTDEMDLESDLGMDSLDGIEIVMALEEEFSVEIPDEDADKLKTVKDVLDYVEKRKKDKK